MTSAWPHADVIVDQVNGQRPSVSGGPLVSQRVSPTGGTRVSVPWKEKKKKARVVFPMSSWASLPPWPSGPNSARPLLLLFLFLLSPLRLTTPAHLSATPGSRAASSRSGANSSACVRVCVLCVLGRLATPRTRTRRRGVGTATFQGNGGSAWRSSRQRPILGRWPAHACTS